MIGTITRAAVGSAHHKPNNQEFDLKCAVEVYFHTFGNMKTSNAITVPAALAQETRLDIFRLLVQHAPNGVPAGTIARNVLAAAELTNTDL
jgi:hypothetical protein